MTEQMAMVFSELIIPIKTHKDAQKIMNELNKLIDKYAVNGIGHFDFEIDNI